MSHLPRLLKVIRGVAKYRLDDFLPAQTGAPNQRKLTALCLLLATFRLPRILSRADNQTRNHRLRLAIEELGPIYVKFGQLLSTRRDFLDNELADELQSLQDNVPPFKSPSVESIIEAALGAKSDQLFKQLDSNPFASASVAQVHKATLHNDEEVVVKVIRPKIESTIAEDLTLLKWIASLFESHSEFGKRLRPIEVVNDYEKVIFDELDLQIEAANTSKLKSNFENSDVLYVPKVYWDYTRRNVLVLERIHGIPVTDTDSLNKHRVNLKKLAETGVEIFFTQVFEHNFFHADMHPGNIFVSNNNPELPSYIAIDCAIIGSLSDNDQEYLAKNLLAIFKRDYRRVAELHIASGWVAKTTNIHEFEFAMRIVCEPIFEKPLKEISFGHLLVQLFRTAGKFNMEVQPSLVLLQKTLLNIEGLGRQLYPDLDIWKTALPYLENWNNKRMNPLNLLSKIQENIPEWIDQLPHLPLLFINSTSQNSKLSKINESLIKQQQAAEQKLERQRRLSRNSGLFVLLLAAISLVPFISEALGRIPLITSGLGLLGVYLLCFRR